MEFYVFGKKSSAHVISKTAPKVQDRCQNSVEIDHQVVSSYSVYGVPKVSTKLSIKHQCIMTNQVHDQSFITA